MINYKKVTISVIGGRDCNEAVGELARKVGQIIAKMDCILINGGLTGTMMEAARGCKEAGGITIGLLPGTSKADANPYVDIAITTTIGFARNVMVACSGDIIIALPGSFGKSSEISYGMVYKKPIIDLGGWGIDGMVKMKSVDDLENILQDLIPKIKRERGIS